MPASKFVSLQRKGQRSRNAQLRKAREARKASVAAASSASTSAASSPPHMQDEPTSTASASKRKLSFLASAYAQATGTGTTYAFIDLTVLQNLFKLFLCPVCQSTSVSLRHSYSDAMGMAVELEAFCTSCEEVIATTKSSTKISSHVFDINRRIVMAFLQVGLGHSGLTTFCEVMGMKSLGETSHQDHKAEIVRAAERAKQAQTEHVVQILRQEYISNQLATPDEDDILNISVSYDGSWQKRGHLSNHGVGCVIDSVTGLVVDYEAMSLYCQQCATVGDKLDKDGEEYKRWAAEHRDECEKNHTGSSGAMEVAAAKVLWQRSLQHKLRYTTMISDGDCKTHMELLKLCPYGDSHPVLKEECINHFAKRLGTALRKLVTVEKARGVTLGGCKQGSLTQNKIVKLQTYFQRAILDNPGSLEGMKRSVWATYFHATSTDAKPQHHLCPAGVDSWCLHQKATAQNLPPPPHKSSVQLNEKVAEAIKPVLERLTADELLRRCLQGKTQNPNESLHSIIWRFCPKTSFVGASRIRLGLYLGCGQFNFGSSSLHRLLRELNLSVNQRMLIFGERRDRERITRSEKAVEESFKKRKEVRRMAHQRAQRELENSEGGPSYLSGGF